jgi:HSP20 family protein
MATKDLEKQEAATPTKVERTHEWPTFTPPVDIVEQKDAFVLKADMPGADPQTINVEFEQGVLTIHAGRQTPERTGDVVWQEYREGDYERSFTVSNDINADGIKAEYVSGVLTLTLPKSEQAKPKKISVNVS